VIQQAPVAPAVVPTAPNPAAELYTDIDRQIQATAQPKSQKETVIRQTKMPEQESKTGNQTIIHIDKLYLQAEDCETLLDFARMIFHVANKHKEAFV
jgi:hypothetical protein